MEGLKPAFIALHRAIVLALPKELSAYTKAAAYLYRGVAAAAVSSRTARQSWPAVPCHAAQRAVAAGLHLVVSHAHPHGCTAHGCIAAQ